MLRLSRLAVLLSLLLLLSLLSPSLSLDSPSSSSPSPSPSPSQSPFRVAIIGSGVGGSTCAYFLRQLFPSPSTLSLTLYERSPHPGGRVQSTTIDGHPLEAGASIIHHTNAYLRNLSLTLNLNTSVAKKDNSRMGIWDAHGRQFVFTTTAFSFINLLKLLWHFGLSFFHLLSHVNQVRDRWLHLYPLQLANTSYPTPEALLQALTLYSFTQQSIASYLSDLPSRIMAQLVTPVLRVNYNQQSSINALAGSVGLIPLTDDDVFAIDGGNRQLIEGAIRLSLANLFLNRSVHSLRHTAEGAYELAGTGWLDTFDAVVIAAPLDQAELAVNLSTPVPTREYKRTVATFVTGVINASYFGYSTPADLPSTILTTDCTADPPSVCAFSSFSQYYSNATSNTSVYKLFSSQVLTEEVLGELFVEVKGKVEVWDWLAYPVFHEVEQLSSWTLGLEGGGSVWYANAFEQAVSCMECAAVSAKNVALLIKEELVRRGPERARRQLEKAVQAEAEASQRQRAQAGGQTAENTSRPVHLDL